ncbi:MAG: molybdopterin molybdotransferase MoeA [Cyanobacteria bacterium]|nr:molybdopterin molybdotransferase MoeA [Cyanobacteriota bacterium]
MHQHNCTVGHEEKKLLSYDEALSKILDETWVLPTEDAPIHNLLHRYLAEPIVARFDLPRFDNSAVDGFGVLLADVNNASGDNPVELKLVSVVAAGASADAVLSTGSTIKILTGAPVHPSVEAVVMKEFCHEDSDRVRVEAACERGENIRRRGEELSTGAHVMAAGVPVTPPIVALLASFGHAKFAVHERPRVTVVSTGDELVKPGAVLETLAPGEIFESNTYGLEAALRGLGIEAIEHKHVRDDLKDTEKALADALESSDVIISAGGVSVGDRDYVTTALENLGVRKVFWRVAVKPGKPVYFGFLDKDGRRKLFFALPGNPVSSLVTFQLFVKPALMKMQGCSAPQPCVLTARLSNDLKKTRGRLDFVRGILGCCDDGALNVLPSRGQGSHMLSGLAGADCLIHFPADEDRLSSGETVSIQRLEWYA